LKNTKSPRSWLPSRALPLPFLPLPYLEFGKKDSCHSFNRKPLAAERSSRCESWIHRVTIGLALRIHHAGAPRRPRLARGGRLGHLPWNFLHAISILRRCLVRLHSGQLAQA
jgi:hypothetical protein